MVPWFNYQARSRISRTCLPVVNLTSPHPHNLGTVLKPETRAGPGGAHGLQPGAPAHEERLSRILQFSEALGQVVEVDAASIVRSGEAPAKEAPRSWPPPYLNAERHELNAVSGSRSRS